MVGKRIVAGDRREFGAGLVVGKTRAKIPGKDWSRFVLTGEVSPHWRMQADGIKMPGQVKGTEFAFTRTWLVYRERRKVNGQS